MAVVAPPDSEAGRSPGRVDDAPVGRSRAVVTSSWFLAALAAVTVLLGVAIPLAPVTASDPVVTWPKAGQPATSTTLPLTPYRPLSIQADVPCDALRRGGAGLRTQPASAGSPGRGLTVAASGGRVTVTASGETVLDEVLPLSGCTYRIAATGDGTRVERDGRVLVDRPGTPVPQVAELATDTPGTPGLSARVNTDDRYSSVPGGLKTTLLVLHLIALAALLTLAYRRWRGGGPRLPRPRPHPADAVVAAVSALWVIVGPLQNDDSWYTLMARNAGTTGYIGNQIYMFNATENPFVASQYAMALWGAVGGWGLLWMRLLPLLLGLITWVLLRILLAAALGRIDRNRWVPWTLLVAHLGWWLPYGMALRPEVFIVPLAAAVMVLAETARQREAVGPLIPASALAALAVTVSPSGLVAAAPVVVALPWLWRWLAARRWRARLGAAGAVIAAATVAVPVGFGDATLGDVIEATKVHSWYYVTFPWYEEWAHYRTLIETGTWGRRLPVLVAVVLLVVVAIGSGRRGPIGGRIRDVTLGVAVTTAVALALLALGPTKWVNHFGAVAAPGTVLTALCMLQSPLPRRAGALVTAAGVVLISGATVLGFAGPNTWKPYSDRGQPFGNHLDVSTMLKLEAVAPHIGPVYLRQVWWWLILAVLVGAFVAWRRRHRRRSFGLSPERAVLVASSLTLVLGMIAVMVYAPWVQRPGWTVASSQLQALAGRPCQLQNSVSVMAPVPNGLGAPTGPAVPTGDFALAAGDPSPVPAPTPAAGTPGTTPGTTPGPALWHDAVDQGTGSTGAVSSGDTAAAGETTTSTAVAPPDASAGTGTGTGSLTTGWYPIPPGAYDGPEQASHIVVPVAGNEPERQRVVVQFGSGPAAAPVPGPSVTAPLAAGLTARQWQEVPVQLPGSRPTAVRVIAEDRVAGADSALAVGAPQLSRVQPVGTVTDGRAAFADQLSTVLWPCVDQVTVRNGIAPTPQVRLSAAEGTPEFILTNPTYESWGGTMVQSERTWATVRVYSQVTPGGPPTLAWGNVDRIVYDNPTDNYDLTVNTPTRGGLVRFPTLASEAYSGREYLG